ncbi:MAG: class I SAM-dependent methyltransferase [Acidimicrobiia bacterium]|nr:class I SAM-dependent methyltransferase [Acidimicrobiia bacterium]
MGERYRQAFSWDGVYGRVVRLVERVARPGAVVDLGCGWGAVAEPLSELGFHYVGLDLDQAGLDDLRSRGFEAHELDLRAFGDLTACLRQAVGDREVSAVLLLDVLEHVPETAELLSALGEAVESLGGPRIVLSVPNVAHVDLGAKLVSGRWDVTPTGLLDETHVRFFTSATLDTAMGRHGFAEVARDDFALHHSDQHFPGDHPALADAAPLAGLLRHARALADGHGEVNQFVRAYERASGAVPETGPEPEPPFLTVVVRTQGSRPESLLETLVCLAAQTVDDLEVLLCVHSSHPEVAGRVRSLVAGFARDFTERVEVLEVEGGPGPPAQRGARSGRRALRGLPRRRRRRDRELGRVLPGGGWTRCPGGSCAASPSTVAWPAPTTPPPALRTSPSAGSRRLTPRPSTFSSTS